MTKFLLIFIISLLIIVNIYFLKEHFQDALEYEYGAVFAKDVKCHKDLNVNNKIKVNSLCPLGLSNCATKDNFSFVTNNMPKLSPTELCIGDQCINKQDLLYIKNNILSSTNDLKFKVESSGLVSGVRWGLSRFYVNGVEFKNLPIGRGFNVLVVNQFGNKHDFKSFDTHASYDNTKIMINFLKQVPNDYYVLISAYDEASDKDSPYINIYEHTNSKGWKKTYKLNSDGSETKINSTWSGKIKGLSGDLFPNDAITSFDISDKITSEFYEHDFDKGWGLKKPGPIFDRDIRKDRWGFMNDEISTIRLRKTNSWEIVTPYEALKAFGGSGGNNPNHRGSYIFIGKKGGPGYQYKKDANETSTRDTYLKAERSFSTPYLFVNIKSQ